MEDQPTKPCQICKKVEQNYIISYTVKEHVVEEVLDGNVMNYIQHKYYQAHEYFCKSCALKAIAVFVKKLKRYPQSSYDGHFISCVELKDFDDLIKDDLKVLKTCTILQHFIISFHNAEPGIAPYVEYVNGYRDITDF